MRFSIQESGDYDLFSYRTIGVFSGKGNLTVKDGKATAQGEKGNVTMQLFTDKASGKSICVFRTKAAMQDANKPTTLDMRDRDGKRSARSIDGFGSATRFSRQKIVDL